MFLLDTNVFIECHKIYPKNLFPSIWNLFEQNTPDIQSIDAVYDEIDRRNVELYSWAQNIKRNGFFIDNYLPLIQNQYRVVASYVHNNYPDNRERSDFLSGADGWLIATALFSGNKVVTYEQLVGPNSQKPKIPNVASGLGVDYLDFFGFLHSLGVSF
jgi:hypothetical protein